MYETYQSTWNKQDEDGETCWDGLDPSEKLPPLKHSGTDTDGWEDLDVPVLYFYGGFLPYVSQYVYLPAPTANISFHGAHPRIGTYSSGH